jgi:hypothetical protein
MAYLYLVNIPEMPIYFLLQLLQVKYDSGGYSPE